MTSAKSGAGHGPHKHDDAPPAHPHRKRRRWGRTIALGVFAMLLVGGLSLVGAEYYTARPDFCGTCHVMDPYYKSWSHDRHGTKLGVRCVDCHYAPGEQHTIHAKFKGLSQVTSYFSGRYGAARPRAHVSDKSCLTSGCHGDGEFLKKSITIGERRTEIRMVADRAVSVERLPTVHYSHEKHLKVESRLADLTKSLDGLKDRLRKNLTLEQFSKLDKAVNSIELATRREADLKKCLADQNLHTISDDAHEWMRLEHLKTRLLQLNSINCAACHTYDAAGNRHFSVDRQACFTCHFTGQAFNRETAECLRCHEPPVRRIAIHGMAVGQPDGASMMDHRDIVSRKIDCASCHFDVVQAESQVTLRECTHCHDQDRYLKNFESRNTATVQEYHEVHVAQQRARCGDCHRAVQHRLIEPGSVGGSEAPLKPVLDDCAHCHPNHHSEQVNLLMGIGGEGLKQPLPNAMFGSRMNCRACHTGSGSDAKGDAVVKATKSACIACHSADYEKLFDQWISEISHSLEETEKTLARVRKRADEWSAAQKVLPEGVNAALRQAEKNIQLIKSGHGIHNKNYSLELLDLCTRDLDAALMKMAK